MEISRPYLLFLGDVPDQLAAKTAQGIVDWRPEWCLGQLRLDGCKADCGIPDLTIAEAKQRGARTMIVGVANARRRAAASTGRARSCAALGAGLDVATGLHTRLAAVPEIAEAAQEHRRQLFDVRHSAMTFATGKGIKRPGRRLLDRRHRLLGRQEIHRAGARA